MGLALRKVCRTGSWEGTVKPLGGCLCWVWGQSPGAGLLSNTREPRCGLSQFPCHASHPAPTPAFCVTPYTTRRSSTLC